MKKRGGGKPKGSAYERNVCRRLSLRITKGARDDVFWRSAISGGRATVGKRKGKDLAHVAGDICAVRPEGYEFAAKWFVELKHYRNLQLHRFLIGEGKLMKFWCEATTQAHNHKKTPMLIAKQSGGFPELLLIWSEDEYEFVSQFDPEFTSVAIVAGTLVFLLSDVLGTWYRTAKKGVGSAKLPAHQRPAPDDQPTRRVPVGPVPVARGASKKPPRPKIDHPR